MISDDLRHSQTAEFVKTLGQVKARKHNTKSLEKYLTTYNGFRSINLFRRSLTKQQRELETELQNLPLNFPDRDCRTDFLSVIHEISKETKDALLVLEYSGFPIRRFPFTCFQSELINEYNRFPKSFSKNIHGSKMDYQNHKIHAMFALHRDIAFKVVDRIEFYKSKSSSAVRNLSFPRSRKENINKEIIKRFKTSLSVTQLAYLFGLVTDIIVDKKPNKKELAKTLSGLFETSRVEKPSEQQLYKAFFDVEDSTKEAVKGMLIEMLNRVNRK